ncbi:prohibitin family protein [Egbenema bharatensis]|uniref:prohibitin family protein n=1 Tax=Egbenema bharatensis TaxID=3463334 RepID=UPI003A85F889
MATQTKPSKTSRDAWIASRAILLLLVLALLSTFFVIVNAGERGVLMRFGEVQEEIFDEGIHVIIPLVNSVKKLSVQIQKQDLSTEASSKDLQDVFTDIALNWHILPERVNQLYQQVGDETAIIDRIIAPAIEEVLKAVIAQYTAEEVITKRSEVKAEIDRLLGDRLANYAIAVDDISLTEIHFSQQFSEAVEAKQIAEQEAKRAGFLAIRAAKEAQAKVNLAEGEAEAQRLIGETLTPDLIKKQMVDKWDGKLPLITGDSNMKLLELELDEMVEQKQK